MLRNSRGAYALLSGISVFALSSAWSSPVHAQQTLDAITVVATKTEEKAIDTLAAVSTVGQEQITQIMPKRTSDIFFGVPGVWFQERGDSPATSINIRGLQDFGRVAVVVDGARQNYQQTGHASNGVFFLDPEILAGVDIVRGPVANIYGSGAIGGVASFRTKDVDDILRPGERYGAQAHAMAGSNKARGLGSFFTGARSATADVFAGATMRKQTNYEDGNGRETPNTDQEVSTAIGKVTLKPAEGHQIKLGAIHYDGRFAQGQKAQAQESTFDSQVINDTLTARWRYNRPDDRLFDFDGTVYWNHTENEQQKIANGTAGSGNAITGFIGDKRSFKIDTAGFDLHNTTRVDTGPLRHAFTYGGDYFKDKVNVWDPTGTGDLFTPSGERTVDGGFLQWKMNYASWLEVVSALRYDEYALTDGRNSSSGDRLSPKVTVGVTPVPWFTVYGTYAEGYRAPAVTETLVAGAHPPFATFPGAPVAFTFVPNPNLRAEIGKNKEVGINIRNDNLFIKGDKLRLKANVYRNDLTDYIESTPFGPINFWGIPSFIQYRNIQSARIEGWEFEGNYDTGDWFLGMSGHHIRGENLVQNIPLLTIPPDQIATTFGVRFWDRKVTASVRWAAVQAKGPEDIPDKDRNGFPDFLATRSYNLVNLYLGYQPNDNVLATFSVDNILDAFYIPYMQGLPDVPGQAPGVKFAGAGITYKAGLQVRFGAM